MVSGLLALVAALGFSTTAQASSRHRAPHRPTPVASLAPPIPAGAVRWYVRPAAAPLSIAAENAQTGTNAWRLPGGGFAGRRRGAIDAYVSNQAPLPGERLNVYVNAPGAAVVKLRIFRIGWYGGTGGRLDLASGPLALVAQPGCEHSIVSGLTECDWHSTLSIVLPRYLPSGVYLVRANASDGAQTDAMFILRPATPPAILVQIPVATYEAYNFWGGDSLYPDGSLVSGAGGGTQGYEVSLDRPYETETGAGEFLKREVALVRFMERLGYPVGYTADVSVATEPSQVRGVHVLIDSGHSEYWSQRQYEAFMQAREHGTSLLFISSNTMGWRVRYSPAGPDSSERGRPGHIITSYKQGEARDPDTNEPTGLFPLGGAPLAGSAPDGCITPRTSPVGQPDYIYFGWRPNRQLKPRWLFAGSGLSARSVIAGISGYELDQRSPFTPPGTQVIGESVGARCRAVTHTGEVAETTLFTAPSGALVFATGTMGWLYGLEPIPGAAANMRPTRSAAVVRMTENVLARALADSRRVFAARRAAARAAARYARRRSPR
jgi:hypothetical protein